MQLDLFAPPPPKKIKPRARFTPRDYQQSAIEGAFRLWDDGKIGSLVRLPTGTGKTIVGSLIADLWLQRGDDYRVLVCAHERQLIDQFAEEINDVIAIKPKLEMGDQHCTGREQVIVASRQTLYVRGEGDEAISRLFKFDRNLNWLLICDEAHRWTRSMKSCQRIIEHFEQNPNHRRLGLTATPERSDKTTLSGLFPGIASDYRLFDIDGGPCAVKDGWAVPYDQRFITVEGVDFKNVAAIAGDFKDDELERILGESEVLAKLCTPMLDLVGRRRTIIFSPGTAMARNVALYLNSKLGYECAMSLDGSFPDDARKDIYRRHQRGEFQFLSVCGLCREGYNDPGIQAVACFRPTKSRPLAEQMKGRGCRPMRGVVSSEMTPEERVLAIQHSDKPNCMIIDLVGITGLADCASTASIMADSKPDEVIERANKNMTGKTGPIDVAAEIHKAEEEIEAEKEAARERMRKKQEEQLKARMEREAQLAREQAEMDRKAKLLAEVRYTERQVNSGGGGRAKVRQAAAHLATEGQQKYLYVLGMRGDLSQYTKKQAGRMIDQLKNKGLSVEHVTKVNGKPGPRVKSEVVEPKQFNVDDINALFMEAGRG